MTCREEILATVKSILENRSKKEFTVAEVVKMMQESGTLFSESTIRTHITSRLCSNAPDNHAIVYKDFHRIRRGVYERLKS